MLVLEGTITTVLPHRRPAAVVSDWAKLTLGHHLAISGHTWVIERRSRSFGVRSTEDERLAAITTARIARAYKTPTQAGM